MRRCAIGAIALLWAASAAAQGLEVAPDGEGMRIRNPGPVPVVAVRVGADTRLIRIGPGEVITVAEPPDTPIAGRFDPADWGRALDDLSPGWADAHLRTAGHFLDTVDAGPAGDPGRSINLRLLAAVEPATVADWATGSALRRALVARAARHAPVSALDPLLAAVGPDETHARWPEAYGALPPLVDGVRRAIEEHGVAAVPVLLRHRRWAADRGLNDPALHAALGVADPPEVSPGAHAALLAALEAGDFDRAAALAGPMVSSPDAVDGSASRAACGALDTAAQRALKVGRLIAAEGWLRLAGPVCGEAPAHRDRASTLFRVRGDRLARRGDLVRAVSWYRAGFWLAEAPVDRARLADTHADLALLRFGEGAFEAGDRHLDAARAIAPLRPRVQDAIEARPSVDARARVGIAFIIIVMALFTVRRLKRVMRRDRISDADLTLKPRHGPW